MYNVALSNLCGYNKVSFQKIRNQEAKPGQGQAEPRPAAAAAGNSGGRGCWVRLVVAELGWWQSSDDMYSALAWNTRLLGSIDIM